MVRDTIRRVLLIRLSALGDIIHALPAFQRVREVLPQAHIAWLVEDRFASLLDHLDGLDERILIPRRRVKHYGETAEKLRAYTLALAHIHNRRFDVVFDLQGLLKSAIWARLSQARYRVGYAKGNSREGAWLAYNRCVQVPESIAHIVEHHLYLVSDFLGCPTGPVPPCGIPHNPETKQPIETWLKSWGAKKPVVVLHPGAGWITKQWPAAYYGRLAAALVSDGCSVVVLWGPGEEDLAKEVQMGAAIPEVKLAPPTNFHEMIELVRCADLVVAGDTGPLHAAAAVGTLTLGLYGPSEVERNGPFGEKHVVARNEIDCLECWKTTCGPPHNRRCMTELSIDFVHHGCMVQLEKLKR